MKKFTIDRKTWARGERERTFMIDCDGMKCCLGHIGSQCGYTDEELLDRGTPNSVLTDAKRNLFPETICPLEGGLTNLTSEMICINDSIVITDAEREAQLIEASKGNGFEVEFVN